MRDEGEEDEAACLWFCRFVYLLVYSFSLYMCQSSAGSKQEKANVNKIRQRCLFAFLMEN